MAGRNKLPEGVVRDAMEVTRITREEQAEFQAASTILHKYRSDVLRDAIYGHIEEAKALDLKRFQQLKKQFLAVAEKTATKK